MVDRGWRPNGLSDRIRALIKKSEAARK